MQVYRVKQTLLDDIEDYETNCFA